MWGFGPEQVILAKSVEQSPVLEQWTGPKMSLTSVKVQMARDDREYPQLEVSVRDPLMLLKEITKQIERWAFVRSYFQRPMRQAKRQSFRITSRTWRIKSRLKAASYQHQTDYKSSEGAREPRKQAHEM